MALPSITLAGLNWTVYIEPGASPTPYVTYTSLGSKTLSGATLAPTNISSLIIAANIYNVIAIPNFSPSEDAQTTWTQAGNRYADRIPVQAAPPVMTFQSAFVPSNTQVGLLSADGFAGNVDRLFVFVGRGTGTDAVVFAQIGRASTSIVEASPTDVSKINIPVGMRGNSYGWSFL